MLNLRKPGPLVFAAFTAVLLVASCAQAPPQPAAPPDTRAADEAAIRALDAEWAKAVAAKDVSTAMKFYADNASVFVPDSPVATGKDAILAAWTALVSTPGFSLAFTPDKVVVSKGGDFAYEIGDFTMTFNDKKGKSQSSKAKYVVVWAKQADGSWKAVVDAPTTSQ